MIEGRSLKLYNKYTQAAYPHCIATGRRKRGPNSAITQKILDIQKLNDEDKNAIITTIDALLKDAKDRMAYAQ